MNRTTVLLFSLFLWIQWESKAAAPSDSLGMLGDQLDLYGVLDLFKTSTNLEDFEKKLNSEDNKVNNLDLNNDGQTDYIRVMDYPDGDAHAIVLQVPVSETESQDVAVIELDKTADGQAHVQIVGDEDLYGKDYIVEPVEGTSASQSSTTINNYNTTNNYTTNNNTTAASGGNTVVVNVWGWGPVRYIYSPAYTAWVSPWRWAYYPAWWKPWRPVLWHVYHPRVVRFHPYARAVVIRRSPRIYANVYVPRRVTSRVVYVNRVPAPSYYNRAVRQDNRQDHRQGRQNNRQGNREYRQDGRQDNRQGRQENVQQNRQQRSPARGAGGRRRR